MINQQFATTAINSMGLAALGLASGKLSSSWATAAISFDEPSLRLSTGGTWRAPASGTLEWRPLGAPELCDVNGNALTGPSSLAMALLRLHPQTHLRLRRLYAKRFEDRDDDQPIRPVPYTLVFHAQTLPSDLSDFEAGDPPPPPLAARVGAELAEGASWSLTGEMSFHDEHGLIIDPVAVACALRELMLTYTDLREGSVGDLTAGAGSIGSLHSLGGGRRVHFVTPHGGPYVATSAGLSIGASHVAGAGPMDWPDEQNLAREAPLEDTANLRFGLSARGTLGVDPLAPPPAPASLARDFLRVTVVDLRHHLLGNRSAATVEGVPAPDEHTRIEPAPAIRDTEVLTLHTDGQALLGAMQVARDVPTRTFAAAPIVSTDFDLPVDASTRWPSTPELPVGVTAEAWDPDEAGRIRSEWTANFVTGSNDVDLRLPAGIVPNQAHVRVFPRLFVEGEALAEHPSVERADGASTIAGSGELRLVLRDPLRLGVGTPPSEPKLRFDVVVVPRSIGAAPRARLFGGLVADVGSGGSDLTPPALTRSLGDLQPGKIAECRAPILGLEARAPAASTDALLAAFGEAEPREPPRYPTMARKGMLLAGREVGGTWRAAHGNGWIDARSLEALTRLGNPGNPAGPEERVLGISAEGRLAYDLARATLRLTHHLIERLDELDDSAWDLPSAGSGTIAASVLQTIAPRCENPELSLLVAPLPSDTWSNLASAIGSVGGTNLGTLSPIVGAATRWIDDTLREAMAAIAGRRDAQWALRWHIAHARSLIYVETELLGATADPGDDYRWNLVDALVTRLGEAPNLRVILSLPRRPPMGAAYAGWAKYFHEQRNTAIAALQAAAPGRVLALHPVGFPGRPEIQRGSAVVVDDVWAMLGASTLSRRGLTFDGAYDLSFFDREFQSGRSVAVRDLRRRLMARTLDLAPPASGSTPEPNWVRLARMSAAYDLFAEILADGGHGLIEALYAGPPDVLAQARSLADPEGREFDMAQISVLSTLGVSDV